MRKIWILSVMCRLPMESRIYKVASEEIGNQRYFFVIYWDGTQLRGYIPTKGNSFDRFRKIALGNDDNADRKFLERVKCNANPHSVNYNKEECIKDFKHRIGL